MRLPKINLLAIAFLFTGSVVSAQESIEHEKKVFRDETGEIYWNKSLPFYINISTSSNGDGEGIILQSETATDPAPVATFFDTEGTNWIRTKWEVDPKTGETIYPQKEVMWPINADGLAPRTKAQFHYENKSISKGKIYYSGELTISLTATDAVSGVDQVLYSLNDEPYEKYEGTFKPDLEKDWTLQFYAVDRVGNAEDPDLNTLGKTMGHSFTVDKTAPSSKLSPSGPQLGNIISPRGKLSISNGDGTGSGVKYTYYKFDDGSEKGYYGDVSLANLPDGEHTITYYAVDRVKNKEEAKTYSFYLDKKAPEVTFSVSGDQFKSDKGYLYVSSRSKLQLSGTDNKAGVRDLEYKIDGKERKIYTNSLAVEQAHGYHTIAFRGTDKVENTSKEITQVYLVDTKAPTLSYAASGPQYTRRDTLFVRDITKFKIKPIDGGDFQSGVKESQYQVNNVEHKYEGEFSISGDGLKNLSMATFDNVGNKSTLTQTVFVDNQSPEIFPHFSVDKIGEKTVRGNKHTIYPREVQVFLAATDKHVGSKSIHYSINGAAEKLYVKPIQYFKTGNFSIKVRAVDFLGNEAVTTIDFSVEN